MNYLESDEGEDETQMVKFTGTPNKSSREGEQKRWWHFLNVLNPWGKKVGLAADATASMGVAFAKAELSKKVGEGAKLAAEAAELAARKDKLNAETVGVVNDEIARIFAQEGIPDVGKKLQLANLLASNPQIAEQMDNIEAMLTDLKYEHGTVVEIVEGGGKVFTREVEVLASDQIGIGSMQIGSTMEVAPVKDDTETH